MKTYQANQGQPNRALSAGNSTKESNLVSLQLLVNQFLGKCMTEAFRTKSMIVNRVPRDIRIPRSNAMIAPVMREMLNIVARNAYNGDITITAELFRDIIILKIQDRNNNNGYAVVSSLKSLEPDALMVGGSITVEGAQQKIITISLSFPGNGEVNTYEC